MSTVVIGSDICPIERNRPFFLSADVEVLFGNLLPELRGADLAVANLESPLIEQASPIPKTGPIFGEPGACISGIRNAGIDVLGLANNHVLDHGELGLRNTLQVCQEAGVATVGAGKNLAAARRMLIREVDGTRVGILAMAEHEFSIATRDGWGANPLDVIDFVRNVRENRDRFDYLVVLLHGGFEFAPYPSPRIRDTSRFLVEMGANAVFVQHTHCLGGYEQYQGGYIFYGQGAVIMDEAIYRNMEAFHEGYLVKLTIDDPASPRMEMIPFRQSSGGVGMRKMTEPEAEELFQRLAEKSKAIEDDEFVEREWLKFCEEQKHAYMSSLLGHNRILRKLNFRGWLVKLLYGKQALRGVRNCVCCESHREALETILNRL